MYDPTADLGLRRRLDDCIARQQVLEQQLAVRDGQIDRLQSALAEAALTIHALQKGHVRTERELKEAWKRPLERPTDDK